MNLLSIVVSSLLLTCFVLCVVPMVVHAAKYAIRIENSMPFHMPISGHHLKKHDHLFLRLRGWQLQQKLLKTVVAANLITNSTQYFVLDGINTAVCEICREEENLKNRIKRALYHASNGMSTFS